MLIRFFLYGSIGCILEFIWTGISSLLQRDFSLKSTSSLWMFFIYGMIIIAEPVFDRLAGYPALMRGLIYTLGFFAVEYLSGEVLSLFHICPWDYSNARYHVKGLIRFDFAPVWFAAGLFYERVYHYLLVLGF